MGAFIINEQTFYPLKKPKRLSNERKYTKHKLTKATEISRHTANIVRTRDMDKCICCGTTHNLHVHHYLYRSKLGLGIPENLVTLCIHCHDRVHKHDKDKALKKYIRAYLEKLYPCFPDRERKYNKWGG